MIAQIKMINTNYTFTGTDSSPEKGGNMNSANSTVLSKLHKRINNQSSGDKTPV
jgi:hypothetical protein